MKIRDLITELIKHDMDAEVTNDGWYDLTKVISESFLQGPGVVLVFEGDG